MVKEVLVDSSLVGPGKLLLVYSVNDDLLAGKIEATLSEVGSSRSVSVRAEPLPNSVMVHRLRVKAPAPGEHLLTFTLGGIPLPDESSVKCWAELQQTSSERSER